MEGLEASIIKLSQLEEDIRLDAQFYRPKYYEIQAKLEIAGSTVQLGNALALSARGRQPQYAEEGLRVINSKHVRSHRVELDNDNRLAIEVGSPVVIQYGDVLLNGTGVGTIGRVAPYLYRARALPDNHVTVLRTKTIDPIYLSVFLNSPLGQLQIERHIKGSSGQIELYPSDIAKIVVWDAPVHIQKAIRKGVLTAFDIERQADDLLNRAERVLLSELGLADWKPPEPLAYAAKLSQLKGSERWDSRFHRPLFDELKSELEKRWRVSDLSGRVHKGRSITYSENGDVPIIRSGDLADIEDDDRFLRAYSSEPIIYLRRGDVLISSIGFGSIGKVKVFDKPGRYGTVSEVTIIRQEAFNPYYLAAFLRSLAGQYQIDRFITGATGQLHLYPRDVERIFVPVPDASTQLKIQRIAEEERRHRQRARSLLNRAKRAIEIAIEDSEDAALRFLDEAGA